MRARLRTEAIIAASLLAFGVFVLPNGIYAVGQRIIGDYEGGGIVGLNLQLWGELGRGDANGTRQIDARQIRAD